MYRNFIAVVFLLSLFVSGCGPTKISLPSIDKDFDSGTKLSGHVHLQNTIDMASLARDKDGNYSTVSEKNQGLRYLSENHPVDAFDLSLNRCLTSSGLIVTTGSQVPTDTDLVVQATVRKVVADTEFPLTALAGAIYLARKFHVGGAAKNPVSALSVDTNLYNPKTAKRTIAPYADYQHDLISLTLTSGVVRSYRLVQEDFCKDITKKIALFQQKPDEAIRLNGEQLAKQGQ